MKNYDGPAYFRKTKTTVSPIIKKEFFSKNDDSLHETSSSNQSVEQIVNSFAQRVKKFEPNKEHLKNIEAKSIFFDQQTKQRSEFYRNLIDRLKIDESKLITLDEELSTPEVEQPKEDVTDFDEDHFKDELTQAALEYVSQLDSISTFELQSHFSIRFNRANNIIKELASRNYISSENDTKPREVFYKQQSTK